jgi:hypothetical protein
LEKPELSPVLKHLIELSSLPLKSVETDFAVDSSGFTTTRFTKWHDHKYRGSTEHHWVKAHLMCGVKTHIVTAIDQLTEIIEEYLKFRFLVRLCLVVCLPVLLIGLPARADGGTWP